MGNISHANETMLIFQRQAQAEKIDYYLKQEQYGMNCRLVTRKFDLHARGPGSLSALTCKAGLF